MNCFYVTEWDDSHNLEWWTETNLEQGPTSADCQANQ